MYDDHEERKGLWIFFLDCAFRMLIGWAGKFLCAGNGTAARNYFSSPVLLKWMLFLVLLVFSPSEAQKRYVQVIL